MTERPIQVEKEYNEESHPDGVVCSRDPDNGGACDGRALLSELRNLSLLNMSVEEYMDYTTAYATIASLLGERGYLTYKP